MSARPDDPRSALSSVLEGTRTLGPDPVAAASRPDTPAAQLTAATGTTTTTSTAAATAATEPGATGTAATGSAAAGVGRGAPSSAGTSPVTGPGLVHVVPAGLATAAGASAGAAVASTAASGRRAVMSMSQTRLGTAPQAITAGGPLEPRDSTDDAAPVERPRPIPARGMVGPVHVGQAVCWQAALLLLVIASATPVRGHVLAAVLLALSGVALLAATGTRLRGRWAHGWAWLGVRHLLRAAGRRRLQRHDDPSQLPGSLVPGSVVGTLDLGEQTVGVIEHPAGVTVLLASDRWHPAAGADEPLDERPDRLPSPADLLAVVPSDGPDVTAQLVSVVAVAAQDDGLGAAAHAYRELPDRPAAHRVSMLALRVERTPDRWSDQELAETVGVLLRGVTRRLARHEHRLRPVGPVELVALLEAACRLHGPGQVVETWRDWQVPHESQVSFRVTAWPERQDAAAPAFLDVLSSATGLTTVVSLAVRRAGPPQERSDGPDDVELEAAVRLCAVPGPALDAACTALVATAESAGARVRRCDGEQLAGAVATLPFGGFLS